MGNTAIDLIIRIKNGYLARKNTVILSYTRFNEEVVKKLIVLHYVKGYKIIGDKFKSIEIELLYQDGEAAVTGVAIFSKPGRRYYVSYRELKPVLSGYGVSILSTPKGIMTNNEARKTKIGGEMLFNIW